MKESLIRNIKKAQAPRLLASSLQGPSLFLSLTVVIAALLTGCASTQSGPGNSLGVKPESNPSVRTVQAQPDEFISKTVRWGGTIVGVVHEADHTMVEIVSRPIARSARPVLNDQSDGRFLARIEGFLESAIYAADREITAVGRIDSIVQKSIGKANYQFPVLVVENHRLWKKRPVSQVDRHAHSSVWGRRHHGHHNYSWIDDPFYDWPFGHHGNSHTHGSFHGHIRF